MIVNQNYKSLVINTFFKRHLMYIHISKGAAKRTSLPLAWQKGNVTASEEAQAQGRHNSEL